MAVFLLRGVSGRPFKLGLGFTSRMPKVRERDMWGVFFSLCFGGCRKREFELGDVCHSSSSWKLQVFQSIAKDVMLRLKEAQEGGGATSPAGGVGNVRVAPGGARKPAAKNSSSCC